MSCAYPKGPISIPNDHNRLDLGDFQARAGVVPMTICVEAGDRHHAKLVQLAQTGADWWNNWLSAPMGCDVFLVDRQNQSRLFCDVLMRSGYLPPDDGGEMEGYWSPDSNPPGDFAYGTMTLENAWFDSMNYQAGVAIHELGHILSLDDDPRGGAVGVGSVMSSPMPVHYRPTQGDLRSVLETARCNSVD